MHWPDELFAAVLVIPVGFFLINYGVRRKLQEPQSSSADILLLLCVHDLNAAVQHDSFSLIVREGVNVVTSHVVLFVFALGGWLVAMLSTDLGLHQAFRPSSVVFANALGQTQVRPFPWGRFLVCWFISTSLVLAHISLYKPIFTGAP